MKAFKAWIINLLILVFGVNYKPRVSALALALVVTTYNVLLSADKISLTVLMLAWGAALKAFFTKGVGVSNSPNPLAESQAVAPGN